jgi:hypothetical protein
MRRESKVKWWDVTIILIVTAAIVFAVLIGVDVTATGK